MGLIEDSMSDFFEIKEQTEKGIQFREEVPGDWDKEFLGTSLGFQFIHVNKEVNQILLEKEEEARCTNPNFYTKKDSCI